jgi:hypothetical protein
MTINFSKLNVPEAKVSQEEEEKRKRIKKLEEQLRALRLEEGDAAFFYERTNTSIADE